MTRERMLTAIRLLKELTKAQRALGEVDRLAADAEWHRRNDALQAASVAWDRFLATPDQPDFKMKQANDHE